MASGDASSDVKLNTFFIDSGSSVHLVNDPETLHNPVHPRWTKKNQRLVTHHIKTWGSLSNRAESRKRYSQKTQSEYRASMVGGRRWSKRRSHVDKRVHCCAATGFQEIVWWGIPRWLAVRWAGQFQVDQQRISCWLVGCTDANCWRGETVSTERKTVKPFEGLGKLEKIASTLRLKVRFLVF